MPRRQWIRGRGSRCARIALQASLLAGASLAVGAAPAGALIAVSYTTPGEYAVPVTPGQTYRIVALGAHGGNATTSGGAGAMVTAFVTVPSGITTLYVEVPSNGGDATTSTGIIPAGGANGGGDAGYTDSWDNGTGNPDESGGGGGGAADVRTCAKASCPSLTANAANDPRLVVAGGGGGAGGWAGSSRPAGAGGAGSQTGGDGGRGSTSYGPGPFGGTGGGGSPGIGHFGYESCWGAGGGGGGGWKGGTYGIGSPCDYGSISGGGGGGGGSSYGPALGTTYGSAGTNAASVTLGLATPLALTTQVSPSSLTYGGSFHDTATLVAPPTGAAAATGTVRFNFYKPGDTTCTQTPAATSTVALNSAGTSATSADYQPQSVGTYRVVATYSGDTNYPPATTSCSDANEQATVSQATPSLSTQVSNGGTITIGSSFNDKATISGTAGVPGATGTVTFNVYSSADCSGMPVFTSTNNVSSGAATSASFTPTAPGSYRVVATYNGDTNYTTKAGSCGDTGEAMTVNQATPGLSTQVSSSSITFGGSFSDTATLTKPSGAPNPTGQVTFAVYGPDDTTCSKAAAFTASGNVSGTSASSGNFTPTEVGTYRVIATYGGDANFASKAGGCGDTGETVTVGKATLGLLTSVSPASLTLGSSFKDDAALIGGAVAPTGSITFNVYGSADTSCSSAVVFTDTQTVSGSAARSANFTPATAGTYHVIATYSGDSHYTSSTGSCADLGETATVGQATPSVTTQVSGSMADLGAGFTDTATITPPSGVTAAPTGTVTFALYAPSDPNCAASAVATSTTTVSNGGATSDSFTGTVAGDYHVIATYSGDGNFGTKSTLCNDLNESVTVARGTSTPTTQLSPDTITLGGSFSDDASVATATGATAPTGDVTFSVYAPGDSACSGSAVFSSTGPLASESASSDTFTPTSAGVYRVVAAYSGDANYDATSSGCDDEQLTVDAATPSLSTQVSDSHVTLGDTFTDSATLGSLPSGVTQPTGDVTFDLYGAGDDACAGSPVETESGTVSGRVATSDPFTPTDAGTYHVIAHYAGDTNYASVDGGCGDANESVTVGQASVDLSTQVSPASLVLGGAFSDTADLGTPPSGATAPTGTVTFDVYADADCSGQPVLTSTHTVTSETVGSGDFTPTTAADYHVVAGYSGDSNYAAAMSDCADTAEVASVGKASLTLSTQVSDGSITVGDDFTDAATLSGAPDGVAKPTGTVTFDLYASADCTGSPLSSNSGNLNAAGTSATSDAFTLANAGSYHVIASYSGDANYAAATGACADPNESVTAGKATQSVTTQVSHGSVALGGSFTDTASLGTPPAAATAPSGTVRFDVYGPDDATCASPPAFTSTTNVASASAESGSFTPLVAGTYRVIASYSGDSNYESSAGACNDANETVTAGTADLSFDTQVSHSSITLGDAFHDVATLGATPAGSPKATGHVEFDVYGPADPTCSGTPVSSSTNAVDAAGTTATSDDFRPGAAGDYHVIAHYDGDSNYSSADSACGDAHETVGVGQPTLGLTTAVAPADISLGDSFKDSASLGAAPAGAPAATGTVKFDVYGPGDTSCSGAVRFTSTNAVDAAGKSAQSDAFTPAAAGRYRVIARYSGDGNYKAAASDCADATETVGVKATPKLTDTPSGAVTAGGSLTDTAHLAHGSSPTGTITFTLSGPDDTTCSGTPVATSHVTVGGNGDYASGAVAPTTPGTYRWTVAYGGDDDNHSAATTCGDPVTVNPKPVVQTPGGQAEPRVSHLVLSHKTVRLSGGKVRVVLRCVGTKGQACSGSLALQATHLKSRLDEAAAVKRATFQIAAGRGKTLKLTLPKTTAAQLKRSRKAVAYVIVSVKDAVAKTQSKPMRVAITIIR